MGFAMKPVLRLPGHVLFGHLGPFRDDRVEFQLRVGRAAPDIARLRFGLIPVSMVSSPAIAHEMLVEKSDAFFKSQGLSVLLRPLLGDGLLTSEDAVHTRRRRLLAPAFTQKRLAVHAGAMVERSRTFAEQLERRGGVVEVADGMMRLTLEILGATLFDSEVGTSADEVSEAVTVAMQCTMKQLGSLVPLPPHVPSPTNLRYRRAVRRLDAILYEILRARRARGEGGTDILGMLLAARDEDGSALDDAEVRDEAMTIFLAGHETTANALAWSLYLLARHPEVRERVEREVDALDGEPSLADLPRLPLLLACLKETMRLYPPAYLLGRRARRDLTLAGHRFRKGSIVLINVLGIHRRADLHPDPEAFLPERFMGDKEKSLPRCAYMPFGAGPRICIGNHFATMEAHLALATLLRRLRFELTTDAPIAIEPLVTLRPKRLPMRVVSRRH